jgi:hypothetical protein
MGAFPEVCDQCGEQRPDVAERECGHAECPLCHFASVRHGEGWCPCAACNGGVTAPVCGLCDNATGRHVDVGGIGAGAPICDGCRDFAAEQPHYFA